MPAAARTFRTGETFHESATRGFVEAPKASFSSRRTPAVIASRSSARESRSSAKTDQVRVVRPSSWTP